MTSEQNIEIQPAEKERQALIETALSTAGNAVIFLANGQPQLPVGATAEHFAPTQQ